MLPPVKKETDRFMEKLIQKNPGETEFHQAVREVTQSVMPLILENKDYREAKILERMTEPDRTLIFRVTWQDDEGKTQVNRGFRIQFNNSIGPYKGGLRFHESVNLSILKFLAFEQIFKNSLTTLPLGGGKGGSDFNPKGKSDPEVMRFCQSFMTELSRFIGHDLDIPAGDIGVGPREIGYLFGQYKRLINRFHAGTITGKGIAYGGSLIRTEATGYGCVYFAQDMLELKGDGVRGKTCLISGSGNVAQYTAEKLIQLGAKVVTMSDSTGFIFDADGINEEKLRFVINLKEKKRGMIQEYAEKFGCEYFPKRKPWEIKADLAFPCATQNEILLEDAQKMVKNGIRAVCEGANMPTHIDAADFFNTHGVLFAPGKAANAGGVAVSGLEQTQNAMRLSWTREKVDSHLQEIMKKIHAQCVEYGREKDGIDYVKGANIAGFIKVADTLLCFGVI